MIGGSRQIGEPAARRLRRRRAAPLRGRRPGHPRSEPPRRGRPPMTDDPTATHGDPAATAPPRSTRSSRSRAGSPPPTASSRGPPSRCCTRSSATAATVLDAQASSIALHDPATDQLVFVAAAGPASGDVVGLGIAATAGIAGYAFSTGQPLAIADVAQDPRFDRSVAELDRLRAELAAGDAAHRRRRARSASSRSSTGAAAGRSTCTTSRSPRRSPARRPSSPGPAGPSAMRAILVAERPRGGPRRRRRRARRRRARQRDDRGLARERDDPAWRLADRIARLRRDRSGPPRARERVARCAHPATPAGAAAPVDRDDRAAHRLERGVRGGPSAGLERQVPLPFGRLDRAERLRRGGRRGRPRRGHRLRRRRAASGRRRPAPPHLPGRARRRGRPRRRGPDGDRRRRPRHGLRRDHRRHRPGGRAVVDPGPRRRQPGQGPGGRGGGRLGDRRRRRRSST